MPNYRYSSSEYMRRGQNMQPCPAPSSQPCPPPSPWVIAMAYVPWQEWQNLYEPDKGLRYGTIFEDLDKPFKGRGGCCK